jgi:predicted ArsR family transcriptional regulator
MAEKREKPSSAQLRRVGDVRTLRALTHPVRVALIEALTMHGPLTATGAGELIGESPTTCSFHLRQLAKYGFVEEAGGGSGRARPWRITSIGMRIEAGGDGASQVAASALRELFRERQLARYRTWLQTRSSYPKRWRDAAIESEYGYYLTVEEFEELGEQVHQLLMARIGERLADPSTRPAGSVPVEMLLFGYPISPPSEG